MLSQFQSPRFYQIIFKLYNISDNKGDKLKAALHN